MTISLYPNIESDPTGEPAITGADTKLVVIIIDHLAHHWDAVEIQRQRPHLTLGQIYSALAYYYDHEAEMNRLIEQRLARQEELLAQLPASRVRTKLLAAKRTP